MLVERIFLQQVNYTEVISIGSFAFLRYFEKSTTKSISSTSSPRRCPSTSSFDFPNILQIDFTMPGREFDKDYNISSMSHMQCLTIDNEKRFKLN